MFQIRPGSELQGLRIEEVAGRGGSSIVYRATDLASGAPRAVKVLTAPDAGSRRRLEREASLLSTIDHPAIVPFRGLIQSHQQTMLVTDWVAGQSLLERLQHFGRVTGEHALDMLLALADPLDHLHRQGVVHRDISPANVIVGQDGTLTVIDLGIGHQLDASTLTNDDLLAGTPKYLAPEVIRGEASSAASDQYSVAVMIHELVTGRSPFPAAEQVATALHHQLNSTPEALDEIDPSVSTALSNAVLRALSKDPDQRFPSIKAFAAAAEESVPSPVCVGEGRSRPRRLIAPAAFATLVVAGVLLASALGIRAGDGSESGAADGSESGARSTATTVGLDPSVDQTRWVAGTAASLSCNLLTGHGFQNGSVPVDYFGDPPGRERVVEAGGYGNSWALEVGSHEAYGQYGEIVDIDADQGYLFQGWFKVVEPVADAALGITFLDTDYQNVGGSIISPIPVDRAGFHQVSVDTPPAGAVRAVPYLYKDGSAGVLLADELVFGTTEQCEPELADFETGGQ